MSRLQVVIHGNNLPVPLPKPAFSPKLNRYISGVVLILHVPGMGLVRIAILQDCERLIGNNRFQSFFCGNLLDGIVARKQFIRVAKGQLPVRVSCLCVEQAAVLVQLERRTADGCPAILPGQRNRGGTLASVWVGEGQFLLLVRVAIFKDRKLLRRPCRKQLCVACHLFDGISASSQPLGVSKGQLSVRAPASRCPDTVRTSHR